MVMVMGQDRRPALKRPPKTPIYQQIANFYAGLITGGTLKPGDKIPSVMEMAAAWDVADRTARGTLRELKRRRLVYTVLRDGTYVAPPPAPPQ